jgi:hypothetical protein
MPTRIGYPDFVECNNAGTWGRNTSEARKGRDIDYLYLQNYHLEHVLSSSPELLLILR